jgi:hypothetical protein
MFYDLACLNKIIIYEGYSFCQAKDHEKNKLFVWCGFDIAQNCSSIYFGQLLRE